MKISTYTVKIEQDEGGKGFVAHFPTLPGCHTQGKTFEETLVMAREVLIGFLRVMKKQGKEIPLERSKKLPLSFGIPVRMSKSFVAA